MKRVLIVGSSGMLGCDLSSELRKSYEVWGADLVPGYQLLVARFIKCDITDKKSVFDIIVKIKPDVVIHTAAWTDVDGCELNPKKAYRINSDGTKNVVLACKKAGASLVYISTDFVFNGRKKTPYKESDKPSPISVYADSKLAGERKIASTLDNYLIIRTSWLYGKCGKNFVDTIVSKAKTESVLRVVDDQVGSPTYTKDLAKAIHVLMDKIPTTYDLRPMTYGIYHVSNSGTVSWFEYAKTILKMAGSNTKVEPISSEELARPASRPAMSVMNCSKFTKFTGFKMRNWKSALKEYLEK